MVELVLLPSLAALLPWPWAARLFWHASNLSFLYGSYVDAAVSVAREWFKEADSLQWRRRARFHLLVDNADYFLARTRGDRWFARYVRVEGSPLPATNEPVVFVNFHWGQGFWALRYLRSRGFNPAWLHAPAPRRLRAGVVVSTLMGRLRIAQVGRLSGALPIPTGGSVTAMRKRLRGDRGSLVAMPDAPLHPGRSFFEVSLLDRPARIASGFFRMVAEENPPVYFFSMCVNPVDGHRVLRFEGPIAYNSAGGLAQEVADRLTEAIKEDSSAWYVWPHVHGFFAAEMDPDLALSEERS